MSVTDRQLAPRPVVLVGLAGADESAGSCAPTVESLTIGDATSGVITFRNDADSRPGAAIDLAITGEFALDKTTIGPLGPGETEAVTVTVTAVGAQIGVLTATTSGGEVAVSVSSSLSHVPSAIAGLVDAYDARLLDGVTDGAIVTAFPARLGDDAAENAARNGATFAEDAFGAGLHAVQFLGKTAKFDLPAAVRAALIATGEAEAWVVTNGITTGVGAEPVGFGTRNETGQHGLFTSGGLIYTNFAITSQQSLATVASGVYTNPHVVRLYFRADTGRVGVEVDGALVAEKAATFGLDDVLTIGGDYNGTYFWNGDIGECLVFDRFLTGDDVTDLYAYFASVWGVS